MNPKSESFPLSCFKIEKKPQRRRNFPTCTYEDFRNGQKVFCKHILFIMLNVPNSGEFLKSHLHRFIPESSIEAIFSSSIKAVPKDNFIHEVFQRSLKNTRISKQTDMETAY